MRNKKVNWPNGKKFAFSIIDDTDVSSYERIKPIYDLLEELGLRTTKTVWIAKSKQPSKNFYRSQTMEDKAYAALVQRLNEKGFEIAMHGASMESSQRTDIEEAIEKFRDYFGRYPKMHINHAENNDNLYWGVERFDSIILRVCYKLFDRNEKRQYSGHDEKSPYFWGDLCEKYIKYVRNFSYGDINLLKINPSMPYHNERCRYVNLWFSSVDAFEPWIFNEKIKPDNVDLLEKEGGVCILSTHFGKYFVENGALNAGTNRVLTELARRKGWFVPASEILDYLYEVGQKGKIGRRELWEIQYKWLLYKTFGARKEKCVNIGKKSSDEKKS
jgi:hypothetical protein